jgi:hypothetical protein
MQNGNVLARLATYASVHDEKAYREMVLIAAATDECRLLKMGTRVHGYEDRDSPKDPIVR